MTFTRILMYGSIFSPVLPLFIAWQRRSGLNRTFSLLVTLISIALACDIVNTVLALQRVNNMPVAHIYGLLEGLLLLAFFDRLLTWKKMTWAILCVAYTMLYVVDSIFFESIFTFNAWSRSLEALTMIVLCVVAFNSFYQREENIFIEKSPHFWMVIGILTYFSGALFSFLLSTDMLSQAPDRFYGSWMLHNFSNVLKNVIFTIGLWRLKR